MSKLSLWIFCTILEFVASAPLILPVADEKNITLAFGSCFAYYGDEPADIFYRIVETRPDVWVWLGDVAYVDEKVLPPYFRYAGKEKVRETFNRTKSRKEYSFLRDHIRIIGVWDDHDYGLNNGNKYFKEKDEVQPLWLEFMDEPSNSARWNQKGLHISYYLGSEKLIKIILLDVRYFKDPYTDDMLGEDQWRWLANEIRTSTAEYTIIGSGTQIFPDDRLIPEVWYPKSRERLISLIRLIQKSGVILITGDVHFAEILKYPCPERVGYNLYEFTSSGLTHHVSTHIPLGDLFVKKSYPNTFNEVSDRFIERNFGIINFSFGPNGRAKFEVRDYDGQKHQTLEIPRAELNFELARTIFTPQHICPLETRGWIRFSQNIVENILSFDWYNILVAGILAFLVRILAKGILKFSAFLFRSLKKVKKE